MKTNITLSFKNGQFSLDAETGVNLWSGQYDSFHQVVEFARAYCSNLTATVLCHEEGLEEKFYKAKQKREQAFVNGLVLNSKEE